MERKAVTLVWLKKDLRLQDNEALATALLSSTSVLLFYIYEPKIWADPHYDERHLTFVKESIIDLNLSLKKFNTEVFCVTGDIISFFDSLQKRFNIQSIHSTEESGLNITYLRDLEIAQYCKKHSLKWYEYQNNGVFRGLKNRKTWRQLWYDYMNAPLVTPTLHSSKLMPIDEIERLKTDFKNFTLELNEHNFQKGGRIEALKWKKSFFEERIEFYNQYISKPEMSRYGCSCLSPYFAWGNLSIREVFQQAKDFKRHSNFKRQANAFISRLRWQSHFIQKFEQEPRMEFEAINKGFLDLEQPINKDYVNAWMDGKTGYPLVDASMRCVR
ncbi:MAG: deoxyribodipyrimidine photo-lyase, partial [Maribacter sp.]